MPASLPTPSMEASSDFAPPACIDYSLSIGAAASQPARPPFLGNGDLDVARQTLFLLPAYPDTAVYSCITSCLAKNERH